MISASISKRRTENIPITSSVPATWRDISNGSGSVNGSGSGYCSFGLLPSRHQNFFFAYYFLKVLLQHSSKIKSHKKSENSRNKGFSYYFCLMMKGSGSVRPKNLRILQIRLRNTACKRCNLILSIKQQTIVCFQRFYIDWSIDFWITGFDYQ
jgi:hypothetical protein